MIRKLQNIGGKRKTKKKKKNRKKSEKRKMKLFKIKLRNQKHTICNLSEHPQKNEWGRKKILSSSQHIEWLYRFVQHANRKEYSHMDSKTNHPIREKQLAMRSHKQTASFSFFRKKKTETKNSISRKKTNKEKKYISTK